MYPINQTEREIFLEGNKQIAKLSVTTVDGDTFDIYEDDILEGSFSIDRYCASGDKIEIGSAVASELQFRLDNQDGQYTNRVFGGAEILVQIGSKLDDSEDDTFYIPMGFFIVDRNPRKLSTINITALDRMAKFDQPFVPGIISQYPASIGTIVTALCDECNVPLSDSVDFNTIPNGAYMVQAPPEGEDISYRQIIQWCAEIMGTCAYVDWEGELRFEWYHEPSDPVENPVPVLNPSNRFSSDIHEQAIALTGVQVVLGEQAYLAGDNGYVISIEGNGLIQNDPADVVMNIWDAIYNEGNGFYTYTPFEAVTKSAPYIYPLDVVYFDDAQGNRTVTFCTHSKFSMNKNSNLSGKGETEQDNNLILANPLTSRQRVLVESIKQNINQQVTERLQAVDEFNQLISNALGVYFTRVPQADGSSLYYIHDQANLEDSMKIYTMTADGFAWTNTGWNDGNPDFINGIDNAGNAIFNFILAAGIEVSTSGDPYSSLISPEGFSIKYNGQNAISIRAQETTVTDLIVGERLTSGHIQMVPNDAGADFIYVD